MKLHQLSPAKGSRKNRKRIGRGTGSGTGKTAGKGHKGQNARSGGGVPAGFEGGQMPLSRRLPKFGFTNNFRTEYAIMNIDTLEKLGLEGAITPELLVEKGLISKNLKLKILGRGDLTRSLEVTAARFSRTAVEKIEKAGGKAVVA